MGNPELEKKLMWIHITKTNTCPNCKGDLKNTQIDKLNIAIIIICKKCHNKIWYGTHEFFGAFFL